MSFIYLRNVKAPQLYNGSGSQMSLSERKTIIVQQSSPESPTLTQGLAKGARFSELLEANQGGGKEGNDLPGGRYYDREGNNFILNPLASIAI